MQMSFVIPAEEHEVFAKKAFDSTIGRRLVIDGQPGVVDKAEVAEDGKSVEVTVTVDAIIWGDYDGDPANY